MVLSGSQWLSLVLNGSQWFSMVITGSQWLMVCSWKTARANVRWLKPKHIEREYVHDSRKFCKVCIARAAVNELYVMTPCTASYHRILIIHTP